MKPILISGVQPTGRLHIGNYLGAIKNFLDLQESGKYECLFMEVDWHSLTENFDPKEKKEQIMDLAIDYIALGINPNVSTLFLQSHVLEHTELMWLLTTITPFGELSRMTQFKDKSSRQEENVNVGLFTYPVLMAADILLYKAAFVPVGDDQLQHLEFARTLARKFNAKFGETLVEPKPLLTSTPRVMDLKDPKKKMSKSVPNGCLFIDDMPEEIRKKIMSATTDSEAVVRYDEEKKPGLANLLRIYNSLSGVAIADLENQYKDKNYSHFKKDLAEVVVNYFADFREKKMVWKNREEEVIRILEEGARKARMMAGKNIAEIRGKMGLI